MRTWRQRLSEAPQAQELPGPPGAGRDRRGPPLEPPEGAWPSPPLDLDSWPPERGCINVYCFKPPVCRVCHGGTPAAKGHGSRQEAEVTLETTERQPGLGPAGGQGSRGRRQHPGSSPGSQGNRGWAHRGRRRVWGRGGASATHSDTRPCALRRLVRTNPTWPEATCRPTHQGRPGTCAPRIWMRSPRRKVTSSGPEPWQSAAAEARPTAAGRRPWGQCWGWADGWPSGRGHSPAVGII